MEALVLCVDDDRTALMLNEAIFAQTGSKVSCANSGVEAVASLGKDAADVVILDYAMPEIDGYATALEIRTPATACSNRCFYGFGPGSRRFQKHCRWLPSKGGRAKRAIGSCAAGAHKKLTNFVNICSSHAGPLK